MTNIARSLLTLTILAVFTAMFGITSCAENTAPHHDCPIQNGAQVCSPG